MHCELRVQDAVCSLQSLESTVYIETDFETVILWYMYL